MEIISIYSLVPLISGLFVLVLGFFVCLKKPKELLHILFFFYASAIFIWLFGTFKMFNAITDEKQIFWDRFIYIGIVFLPILLYHFGLVYCDKRNQKVLLRIGYLITFLFLIFSQTDYFLYGLFKYKYGVHTIAQPLHTLFLVFFAIYFGLFFINLGYYYKINKGERKKQAKFIFLGYAVLTVIGTLGFLPAYEIPIYPIIFLCGIPFVLFLAYAIIKYNALDIKTIYSEVIITLLNLVILAEIFFSKSKLEFFLRILVLLIVLIFSFILINSVHKEIQRREELLQLTHSLERANLRLQELDRQKTEFLSIASHQLRTPLSIAKGYLELLTEGAYGKVTPETKEILKQMDKSNDHLVKLADEFLNVTRIEQGKTKFSFADKDIVELIDRVVNELKIQAKAKKLSIIWRPTKEKKMVNMDDEKIRHVIFNFIDNAIKYSNKGKIQVSWTSEKNGVAVRVKDNGFGFCKEDEVNFFQKFYRGKNVEGINVTGVGLGLFICNKFIEAHEGHVWAHSQGLGKGSEFGFWIPNKRQIKKKDE